MELIIRTQLYKTVESDYMLTDVYVGEYDSTGAALADAKVIAMQERDIRSFSTKEVWKVVR